MIELSFKNFKTKIDDRDVEIVNKYKWHLTGKYVMRTKWLKGQNKSIQIPLHRYIMDAPKGIEVDHINGNPLDNRRSNLRLCSHAENSKNRKVYKNNKSGHRGIVWDKQLNHWRVQFWMDGKSIGSKLFSTIIEALRYREELERKYYKDFRRLSA